MRKINHFPAIGSLLIILLGIVLVGAWLRFSVGSSNPNALQPTATTSGTCRGRWEQMPINT